MKIASRRIALGIGGLSLALAIIAPVSSSFAGSGSGSTTSETPDGRRILTQTTRNGSTCTMFSKDGAAMCSRTIPQTLHRDAVARCLAMKC